VNPDFFFRESKQRKFKKNWIFCSLFLLRLISDNACNYFGGSLQKKNIGMSMCNDRYLLSAFGWVYTSKDLFCLFIMDPVSKYQLYNFEIYSLGRKLHILSRNGNIVKYEMGQWLKWPVGMQSHLRRVRSIKRANEFRKFSFSVWVLEK